LIAVCQTVAAYVRGVASEMDFPRPVSQVIQHRM